MDLFGCLAQLANLCCVEHVPVLESHDLKKRGLQYLIDAGLCPTSRELFDMYPETSEMDLDFHEQNRPWDPVFPEKLSIFDLLGEYRSSKKEIVIYVEMCKIVARNLNVSAGVLRRVVETHEVAHAVTHLGEDRHGGKWGSFRRAKSEDKELFAQIYAWWHFCEAEDADAEDCFRKLSHHQDSRYNSWRRYDSAHMYLADINNDLLGVRSKWPDTLAILGTGSAGSAGIISLDTIIVPAREKAFENTFLGENRWWPVQMDTDLVRTGQVRYIAVYRKAPIAAVTHWAPIKAIVPWQNTRGYLITFAEPTELAPIRLAKGGKKTAPQSRRYTSFDKLKKARTLDDLF